MPANPNPPVYRICLVGPIHEGMRLARLLYSICAARKQVPAFYVSRSLTKRLIHQLYSTVCPTGLIVFGSQSEEVYQAVLKDHSWIKVLRLLEPGAAPPQPFFSYRNQIFPWPEDHQLESIVDWMGIVANAGPFHIMQPGALQTEELCPKNADSPVSV